MRRRALLGMVPAVATAGCTVLSESDEGSAGDEATESNDTEEFERVPLAERGVPRTVCDEELQSERLVAIGEPAFGPPEVWPVDIDGYRPLTDESTVIGIEAEGRARAYPLAVLDVHEIVNDEFGGPVLVSYCPICRSGMVADRRIDGTAATFDVSGLLWKPPRIYTAASEKEGRVFSEQEEGVRNSGNLVMYDGLTGSYWSQMLAQAICGPSAETRLQMRPSSITTLGQWRSEHPDTEVLLPPPRSTLVDPPVTQ
jgi:hypothetical protein